MAEAAIHPPTHLATANLDPSLAAAQSRIGTDQVSLQGRTAQQNAVSTRTQAIPASKGDIDPALSADTSSRPHDGLPHRLYTAYDAPETDSLSRQPSLGQTSNADSQFTTPTTPNPESGTPKFGRGRLPSISELIANGHDSRPFNAATASPTAASQSRSHPSYAHHRSSRSVGSTGHNSPHPAAPSTAPHMSPSTYAAYPAFSPSMTARSPTTAAVDGPYYGTSHYYPPNSTFQHRRPSAVSDRGLALPPSLNSTSSSGDSGGAASSSMDGYSTTHTTPDDQAPLADSTPRPAMMLPPPPTLMLGGFRCTFEGCTAPPFQTQYLLTSHKNVHSQDRPHYCPVKNCSRGEGGKGFKRKNEMIRHGLVHNSPGYICPFCPEREHRYPRPDNLQRHVRVHHVDKDRDDPALQEVLNQRTEGQGKTRRRRTLTNSPTTV